MGKITFSLNKNHGTLQAFFISPHLTIKVSHFQEVYSFVFVSGGGGGGLLIEFSENLKLCMASFRLSLSANGFFFLTFVTHAHSSSL